MIAADLSPAQAEARYEIGISQPGSVSIAEMDALAARTGRSPDHWRQAIRGARAYDEHQAELAKLGGYQDEIERLEIEVPQLEAKWNAETAEYHKALIRADDAGSAMDRGRARLRELKRKVAALRR